MAVSLQGGQSDMKAAWAAAACEKICSRFQDLTVVGWCVA